MEQPIRVALVGVGNCAAALVQGIEYYRHNPEDTLGLMHAELGGYIPSDIKIVAALDIDERKVGKPLEVAVAAKPNCIQPIWEDLPHYDVDVLMSPVMVAAAAINGEISDGREVFGVRELAEA